MKFLTYHLLLCLFIIFDIGGFLLPCETLSTTNTDFVSSLFSKTNFVSKYGQVFKNLNRNLIFNHMLKNQNLGFGRCWTDLSKVLEGLQKQEPWALKMLDSSGKIDSDLLNGNYRSLGSFQECVSIPESLNASSFETHMCAVNITAKQFNFSLQVFLCMPDSCSVENTSNIVNLALAHYNFSASSSNQICVDKNKPPLGFDTYIVLAIICCFTMSVLAATIFEKISPLLRKKASVRVSSQSLLIDTDPIELDKDEEQDDELILPNVTFHDDDTEERVMSKLVHEFSFFNNFSKLFNMEKCSNELRPLHGIRFISMSWVILGHVFVTIILDVSKNPIEAYKIIKSWSFQCISNGTLSVDTFFLLSGLLTCYNFLNTLRMHGSRNFSWFYFYVHRFLRLTPVYMIILAVSATLSVYMCEGPLCDPEGFDPHCKTDWWTNLLYINNIVTSHGRCFGVSWYLANDFQFFILSPIFIIAYHRKKLYGLILIAIAFFISWTYTTLIFLKYKFYLIDFIHEDYYLKIYGFPLSRIGSYLIGICLGFIISDIDRNRRIGKFIVIGGWMIASAFALASLYGLVNDYDKPMSENVTILYHCLGRITWCISIAWVILACVTNNGSFINSFLSWNCFVPLSRMTYMVYLTHLTIIFVYFYNMESLITFQYSTFIISYLGVLTMSYGVAFICVILFEYPLSGIEKYLRGLFNKDHIN